MAQSHQTCIEIGKIGKTYSHGEVVFFLNHTMLFQLFWVSPKMSNFKTYAPIFLADFKLLQYHTSYHPISGSFF
jgi:hypothetical protein